MTQGAAGLGAVWVTTTGGLARIDEANNRLVGLAAFSASEFEGEPTVRFLPAG